MKSRRSYNWFKKTAGKAELVADGQQALSGPLKPHTSPLGGSWLRRVASNASEVVNPAEKLSSGPYSGGSLYHGTNKTFGSFDLSFAGARDWGDFGVGIYLSNRSSLAISYAHEAVKKNGGGEPVVYVIKANLSNVASFDELMEAIRSIETPLNEDFPAHPAGGQPRSEIDSRTITDYMTSRGFDSAMVGEQFVVYDPSLLSVTRVLPTEDAWWLP